MTYWFKFASIVHVISTCTTTKILYVLPDNVSDVNCPSQPYACATLGQYLLDNGSLPVLSNVEYHFLPGEHHVNSNVDILDGFNLSLIGFGVSPATLVCNSHFNVGVFLSYKVSIRNLVFSQCSGNVGTQFPLNIAVGLFLHGCSYCIVENVQFFGYGFAAINLLQKFYLNNVTIDITIVKPADGMCSKKFVLLVVNLKVKNSYNYIFINQVFISGYNEQCLTKGQQLMQIYVDKSYGMHIEMCNLLFYNIAQLVLNMEMKFTDASILFKNCTFTYNKNEVYNTIFSEVIPTNNVNIKFDGCTFYYNIVFFLLALNFDNHDGLCLNPSNVTIENCDFTDNSGSLILLSGKSNCKPNIFFNKVVTFARNNADILIYFEQMIVKVNGR